MIETIAHCFEEGCGISLEEAVTSPRYAEILRDESSLPERFPANTHEGVALRVGLLRIGTLLNTLPEEQAISEARSRAPDHTWDFTTRALIRFLGEKVIEAAGDCLPDDIGKLEDQWRSGDAETQLRVARSLFELLVGEDQKHKNGAVLTWDSANRDIQRQIQANLDSDKRRVLPRAYGKWGAASIPNCQGKAQMLLAFAKRVGARAFCVNTITSTGVVKDIWRDLAARIIATDLDERGIEYISKDFLESLSAFSYMRSVEEAIPDFFHVGVALQLRDRRWVLIDPHGLAWGVIPPAFRMDEIDRLLSQYGRVLPGLSFQACDHNTAAQLFATKIREVQILLQRSRDLEKVLRATSDPSAAFEAFKNFGEPEFLIKQEKIRDKIGENDELLQWFVHVCFFGQEAVDYPFAMFDSEYLPRRIGSLITYHHCEAMNLFRDQVTAEGLLIHPECEFSLPEYHIAISMINSLSLDNRLAGSTEFFMAHSFDQLTFYNALSEGMPNAPWRRRDGNPELAQAALTALSSLKLMHSNCRERILMYYKEINNAGKR